MGEIKDYLRGLAVCIMWSPSIGIELCMRNYWIALGEYTNGVQGIELCMRNYWIALGEYIEDCMRNYWIALVGEYTDGVH